MKAKKKEKEKARGVVGRSLGDRQEQKRVSRKVQTSRQVVKEEQNEERGKKGGG